MTWPSRYQKRIISAVDELALRLAGTPHPRQEAEIQRFGNRVRLQWRPLFAPYLSAGDINEMVADVVERVRNRRYEIEAGEWEGVRCLSP